MVKKQALINRLKSTFAAVGTDQHVASKASNHVVPPPPIAQPHHPPLQRTTSTILFTGTLLSVSAYSELPTFTKLLHPRTRACGVVSRKLRVRLEVSPDRIREYALGADGTNGLLLAEMDRDWVGFAVLGIKKQGRCRFVLSDNHHGDEEDGGLKRVYEVASRMELAIWSSKLFQLPDESTQTICTTAASVSGYKWKADSIYSTDLELDDERRQIPSHYDHDEDPWFSNTATANGDKDRWISTLAASYKDSDASSLSSGERISDSGPEDSYDIKPARQMAKWSANDAEWQTSPPQPDQPDPAGAQSSHSNPCPTHGLKPQPPSGAPPSGPLSPLKLRARSRATLKCDVVCESIENQRGLTNLTRMQGRVGTLLGSLHWLNKQWAKEGTFLM
ncbi:hypothetical protein HDU87_007436 [Geranomyces variabilis]|uniref:Uncharacterized protein n=1 Tax=Geranomyces variabilis TaxID=109894 RepID=A0AAD5TPY0_9FUNG|nr:hypothetical protein HDU87_007436 [Geranomyces variabilis]